MLMKDGLGLAAAKRVANAIHLVAPSFNKADFIDYIAAEVEPLELKQRVDLFIAALSSFLPADFSECHDILIRIKPHWDHGNPEDPTRTFAAWPLTDFVAVHGKDHPDLAFAVMKELTELFSAEFAIRHFITKDPEHAFSYLSQWVNDNNHHVRRLVSEGTRPRLPWGIRLKAFCHDPTPCLPLLEKLRNDPSEYVRRSVANHLNDIAKDNPEIVINTCQRWSEEATDETKWVIKHACRSLIKEGYKEVFPLLGFTAAPKIEMSPLSLKCAHINLGENLTFEFDIKSLSSRQQRIAVDFVIHHVKANGGHSPKVFKLKELTLKPNEVIKISKHHPIKAITTRKYYSGEHIIGIQINGESMQQTTFKLTV